MYWDMYYALGYILCTGICIMHWVIYYVLGYIELGYILCAGLYIVLGYEFVFINMNNYVIYGSI